MIAQPVTIQLPLSIYDRLKQRAEQAHTSVEDELLQVVVSAVPENEILSPDLEETLTQMAAMDTDALLRAARSHFPKESAAHLEELHVQKQRGGLSLIQEQQAEAYVKQYERAMLIRAQAAFLLSQRGYDVSKAYEPQ